MYDWTAKPCDRGAHRRHLRLERGDPLLGRRDLGIDLGQLALDTVVLRAEIERLVVQRVDLAGDPLRFLALVVDRAGRRRACDADGAHDEERTQDEAARHDAARRADSSQGHGA